jgi:invasion protein IalB
MFGKWVLGCIADAAQAKRCRLALQVVDKTRTHLVLSFVVSRTPQGKPALGILTPPRAVLPAGVSLTLGDRHATVPFVTCAPSACQAGTLLDDGLAAALSGTDVLEVGYLAGPGRPITYRVPIAGFADGLKAWQAAVPT